MARLGIWCIAFLSFVNLHGQGWGEISVAYPDPDIRPGDSFGFSISIDGNYAVVGAPFYDVGRHENAGKAFILEKVNDKWIIINEIENPVPRNGSLFGYAVLIQGNQIFVGAPSTDNLTYEGNAYVIHPHFGEWGGGVSTYALYRQKKEPGDGFGTSIIMVRDVLAIGAPTASGSSGRNGAVYLFDGSELGGKNFIKSVVPSSPDVANFGKSVSGNAKYLFATAPGNDEGTGSRGAAFVFDYMDGFIEIAKIDAPDGDVHNFGVHSAASSNSYAVSSLERNENGSLGAVYVYSEGTGWNTVSLPACVFKASQNENDNSHYGAALVLTEEKLFIGYEGQYVEVFAKEQAWRPETPSVSIREKIHNNLTGFGESIAVSGADILLGDYKYENWGVSSGVVYAFDLQTEPQKYSETYQGTIRADYDHLGSEVDVYGNYAVVAAVNDDMYGISSGVAYVYHYTGENGWLRVAKLLPSDGGAYHLFGSSVSITENRIVISAPGADSVDYRSGKVYVFEKPADGWKDMTETSTITRVNQERGKFGNQVAAAGDEVAITQVHDGDFDDVGYAYVFEKQGDSWTLKTELNPSQRTTEYAASFGFALAYDGPSVAIGSPYAASSNGAVFVFEKPAAGWNLSQTENALLTTTDGPLSVGYSVDIYDDEIISGGLGVGNGSEDSGAAYIFKKGETWKNSIPNAKLGAYPNAYPHITLGYDVCLTQDFAIVVGTSYMSDLWSFYPYKRKNGEWQSIAFTNDTPWSSAGNRGFRIAAWDEHLVVGAENSDTHVGTQSGKVEFRQKSPTVRRVTTTSPDKIYKAGDVIDIQVEFTQPVQISEGKPDGLALLMHDNSTRVASYVGLTDNLKLNFQYVVGLSDSTPRLNYESEMSILGDFNPRTLKKGQIGFKELPHPTLKHSLGGSHFLVIDGDYTEPVPEEPAEEPVEEIPVAVEEESERLYVFPNPFGHSFKVPVDATNVTMTDLTGRIVYQSSHGSNLIEIPGLHTGLYILRISLGSKVHTLKIEKL